jgi:hypothetical protein
MTVVRPMSSLASEVILVPSGRDLVVHRRGHAQPGVAGVVDQRRAGVVAAVLLGDQRVGSAASTAGSPPGVGSCSLATSSDCTTISAGPTTSTS